MTNATKIVYEAVKAYYYKHNYMPTIRELCEITKLSSTSTIHYHLNNLKKEKLIKSDNNFKSRGWRFTNIAEK